MALKCKPIRLLAQGDTSLFEGIKRERPRARSLFGRLGSLPLRRTCESSRFAPCETAQTTGRFNCHTPWTTPSSCPSALNYSKIAVCAAIVGKAGVSPKFQTCRTPSEKDASPLGFQAHLLSFQSGDRILPSAFCRAMSASCGKLAFVTARARLSLRAKRT